MYKLIAILQLISSFSYGQSTLTNPVKQSHIWWQADLKKDSVPGISLDEAFNYLKGRKSKPVIVAVIDNSLDIDHRDLKNSIWTNKKEIPGNGGDDDGNGYVDDVHGWCFTANKNNIYRSNQPSFEADVYKTWKKKFETIGDTKLSAVEKAQYENYITGKTMLFERYKILYLGSLLPVDTNNLTIDSAKFVQYLDHLLPEFKDTIISKIPFATLHFNDTYDSAVNQLFAIIIKSSHEWDIRLSEFDSSNKYQAGYTNYFAPYALKYNKTVLDDTLTNFRSFIGDDPNNFNDRYYGTPVINIPSSYMFHSTMIAGIIAAKPPNKNGFKGISDNAQIMVLCTGVPGGGGEYKDIVNAIYYAVNNGAAIINISTKPAGIETHVEELRAAFDYADKHNVLIVGGAGNDGLNLDNEKYIMGQGSNGREHDTYIRVGGTTRLMNDQLVWESSDFGKETVDIFAPGKDIYSTVPDNQYNSLSGTSFATPMVAGVAALLKSYFPGLTAKQIKEILMKSAYKPNLMVIPPFGSGIQNKIPFSEMSKSGGIVNAYNAVKMADDVMGKKHSLQQ